MSITALVAVFSVPNAIVYAGDYVPITKMIKTGMYLDFIGIAFITMPIAVLLVSAIVG